MPGVGVRRKWPSSHPPLLTGRSTFWVGSPRSPVDQDLVADRTSPRGVTRAVDSGEVVGGEAAAAQEEQLLELVGGHGHHHLGILAGGGQLGDRMQQGHLVATLPGRVAVTASAGGEFADGQSHHHQQDLGDQVRCRVIRNE